MNATRMHRSPLTCIGILLSLCAMLLAVQAKLFDAIVYFIIAGIIPGTNYALSPLTMLILVIITTWMVSLHLTTSFGHQHLPPSKTRRTTKASQKVAN